MKRFESLMLALMMCLSLCACGGNNTAQKTDEGESVKTSAEEEKTLYQLGDVIETELFRITPTFTGYAHFLSNVMDKTYLTFVGYTSDNNPYQAADGKVELFGEIFVEYIGSEKTDVSLEMGISVDFDDGYIYDAGKTLGGTIACCTSPDGDDWSSGCSMVFEPFGATKGSMRYCLEVPEQIETGTDKSLIATITVNGELYRFDFRSAEVCGSEYSTRSNYYQQLDEDTKEQIVACLKASNVEQIGWYGKTVGVFTFVFDDTTVNATLPINSSYQYEFEGTYEVFSGAILIDWSHGEQMHLDYAFDGETVEILDFEHGV